MTRMTAQRHIDRICEYRGVPSVKKGQRCSVGGRDGKIVGVNSSCNFSVKFDDNPKQTLNCHPYWKMKIFNDDGSLLFEYKPVEEE